MRAATRTCLAALLAAAAALLGACGGSGKGLIPEANAGPLRADFEAVAQAAQSGNGSCAGTETALGKTEKDFLALPASIAPSLRGRLQEGISNLRQRALAMCSQPVPTVTSTTSTTTTPPTTPQTTPTTTPTNTTTTTTPPNEGGGTPAGEAEQEPGKGKDKGEGKDKGVGKEGAEEGSAEGEASGGTRAGGASPGQGR